MNYRPHLIGVALCALLAACGAPPAAAIPTPAPAASEAPAPTAAPAATARPSPTIPPIPTSAPAPTQAPTEQPTERPTEQPTAEQPTASPSEIAAAAGPLAPTAAPTAAGAQAVASDPVRLEIAGIGLDRALISVGLDERRVPVVPNHDVGWYNLSARPGQGENIVLWGHVLRFRSTPDIAAPFAGLKDLPIGAEATLYSADGVAHRYVVTEKVLATPDQVEYILPRGRELLTMVSCIGDKVVVDNSVEMTHRLITIAEPVE